MLTTRGVDFKGINVVDDPDRWHELQEKGWLNLPVVKSGSTFVPGIDLDEVAKLVGVDLAEPELLPIGELQSRMIEILGITMSFLRGASRTLQLTKCPGRDRTLIGLCNHIVAIADSFRRVTAGASFTEELAQAEPREEQDYAFLEQQSLELDAAIGQVIENPQLHLDTYFGVQTLHQVAHRTTWHMAQHLRQLEDLCGQERSSQRSAAIVNLSANLPLPKEIWT